MPACGRMLIALLLCAAVPQAVEAQGQALPADIAADVDALEPQVIAWRRDIHAHPELSNREFRTADKVAVHLRSLGLDVQTGVAHTGVVGLLRGGRPGPVVALRADMDALPITERSDLPFASAARALYNGDSVGVMHACGHDAHVAILMAVAQVLAKHRDRLAGSVKFIFQPAEEGPPTGEEGGAAVMVKEGVLHEPDVDVIFALHIDARREVGRLAFRAGGVWASSDNLRIVVRGTGSHGAAPWRGADPVAASAQIITGLQTVVSRSAPLTQSPAVVTIGSIHGGNRGNIVPEEVVLLGTIRALDPDVRALLHRRIREVAGNIAIAMGVTADVTIGEGVAYPVTVNDAALTARMGPVLAGVRSTGVEDLVPQTVAEDFSYFANEVPGFYFQLGGRPATVPVGQAADHHTPGFFIDESAMIIGVRAMTALTLAYLNDGAPGQ